MALPADIEGRWLRGRWVRRRYFVSGEYIKPIPGEPWEAYDPFDDYFRGKWERGVSPLHVELARLDPDDANAVEEFTRRWGLLGIFQHNLVQVRYIPTRTGEVQPKDGGLFVRDVIDSPGYSVPPGPDLYREELVTKRPRRYGRGRVIVQNADRSYEEIPLDEYYYTFFPNVGLPAWYVAGRKRPRNATDEPVFPSLRSPLFWEQLCEPLNSFKWSVSEFKRDYKASLKRESGSWHSLQRNIEKHLLRVHPVPVAPLSPAQASAELNFPGTVNLDQNAKWRLGWAFPSLLAAAYLMLVLDMTNERSARVCANETCAKPFAASRPDQLYCSPNCLSAHKQRLYRERKKAAKRSQEIGE